MEDATNNNNKPITLDDLAVMVKNGFDEMGVRLDGVEQKIGGVEGRLDKVEGKLGKVEGWLDKVEQRLTSLEYEMQKRPTIEQIDLKFTNMENRLKADLGEKPLKRDRILNTKTDTVAVKLEEKRLFTSTDVHEIRKITPIAVSPVAE